MTEETNGMNRTIYRNQEQGLKNNPAPSFYFVVVNQRLFVKLSATVGVLEKPNLLWSVPKVQQIIFGGGERNFYSILC